MRRRRRGAAARSSATLLALVVAGALPSAPASAQEPTEQPADPAATAEWQSVVAMLGHAMKDLNDADRALAEFAAGAKLTRRGKAAIATLTARDDVVRTNLQSTLDAATLLAARPKTTAADAARFRTANLVPVSDAEAGTRAARAALNEASYVDHSDEERAAAAQLAAERAAAAADAAAAAAARAHADLDAKLAAVATSLKEQSDRAKPVGGPLDTLLMRNDLTSDARNTALRLQRRLDANAQARMGVAGRMSALKSATPVQIAGLTSEANGLAKELTAVSAEVKALVSNAHIFIAGAPTAAESQVALQPVGDLMPVCEFTFEPADGRPMLLGIDGGGLRAMPFHARLASGRHALSLRRDADSVERHELLLCGYVSTVPIEPIK